MLPCSREILQTVAGANVGDMREDQIFILGVLVLVTYFLHLPKVEIQDRKIIATTLVSLATVEQQKVKHLHINTKGVLLQWQCNN